MVAARVKLSRPSESVRHCSGVMTVGFAVSRCFDVLYVFGIAVSLSIKLHCYCISGRPHFGTGSFSFHLGGDSCRQLFGMSVVVLAGKDYGTALAILRPVEFFAPVMSCRRNFFVGGVIAAGACLIGVPTDFRAGRHLRLMMDDIVIIRDDGRGDVIDHIPAVFAIVILAALGAGPIFHISLLRAVSRLRRIISHGMRMHGAFIHTGMRLVAIFARCRFGAVCGTGGIVVGYIICKCMAVVDRHNILELIARFVAGIHHLFPIGGI